jgi:SAM-dependent methyltransferase
MTTKIDYGLQYGLFHEDSINYFESRVAIEYSRLETFLPKERKGEALDIGCGRGYTLGALVKSGYQQSSGIDIDQSQITYAKNKCLKAERIDSIQTYLSTRQSKYNLITMLDVLEHIPPDQQISVISSIYSALTPGGRLIVQVPNANSILASRWRYNDCTHVCSFTEQSIHPILISGGFGSATIPPTGNSIPRPSINPKNIFKRQNRLQFLRWTVRHLWRLVILAEIGDTAMKIPLGLNLIAIADKQT